MYRNNVYRSSQRISQNLHVNTVLSHVLNKVTGACIIKKQETQTKVFTYEFWEIFKKTCLSRTSADGCF